MAQAFHLARSLIAVAANEPSAEGFARQAKAVLGRSRIFDLRQLEVDCQRECVVLRGSVNSFYHKQLAQELIKTAIDGVEVINDIRVDYSLDRSSDMREWD